MDQTGSMEELEEVQEPLCLELAFGWICWMWMQALAWEKLGVIRHFVLGMHEDSRVS